MHRASWSFVLVALAAACGAGIPGAEPPMAAADSPPPAKPSKGVRTEDRRVERFDRIYVAGTIELKVTVGSGPAVSVTTDDNLLASVRTETRGTTLRIETLGELKPTKGIRVTVATPAVEDLRLEGTVSAAIENLVKPDADFVVQATGTSSIVFAKTRLRNFDVALSGTSKLDAKDVQCRRLHVTLDGAASSAVGGTAEELRVDADGTGKGDFTPLAAKTVIAALNGSAVVEVSVSESLRVRATGTSKLIYSGNPTKLDRDAQAPAEVRPR